MRALLFIIALVLPLAGCQGDRLRSEAPTPDRAIAKGSVWLHESGTYVRLTDAAAELA